MGGVDLFRIGYDIVLEFCHKYARGTSKIIKGPRDMLERIGNNDGS